MGFVAAVRDVAEAAIEPPGPLVSTLAVLELLEVDSETVSAQLHARHVMGKTDVLLRCLSLASAHL
jgi:hypothetical protein